MLHGGCMEVGGIWGLGWVVGTDVGIRLGWQQWGHRCSLHHHLGVIHHVLRWSFNIQRVVLITPFVGCWGPDLTPAIPLIHFVPITPPTFVLIDSCPCPALYHVPALSFDHPHHPCHHCCQHHPGLCTLVMCRACRCHAILDP